jgi:hypothetical protein
MPDISSDYRIEKTRLPVSMTLRSGASVEGALYVQSSGHHLGALEDAPEIMNSPAPFFPFALESGGTTIVAKDSVRSLTTTRQDVHDDAVLGLATRVEVTLRDGARLTGTVFVEPISGSSRILDFLNRHTERFITLFRGDEVILLHRTLLESVRLLS